MDLRLRMGSTMLVCGPSNSGKTVFIMKMIDAAREMFDIPPKIVYWCFGHQTALHHEMRSKNFNMIEGIPPNFDFVEPNSIVMLDDLMVNGANNKNITNLFIAAAHHVPCFVIYTLQNLFFQSREMKTRTLNTNYYVLFKNTRDPSQVGWLGRQVFPDTPKLLGQAFRDATVKPHSYLFLDFRPETPAILKMRARILPEQKPMVVYVNKQLHSGITTSKHLKLKRNNNGRRRRPVA